MALVPSKWNKAVMCHVLLAFLSTIPHVFTETSKCCDNTVPCEWKSASPFRVDDSLRVDSLVRIVHLGNWTSVNIYIDNTSGDLAEKVIQSLSSDGAIRLTLTRDLTQTALDRLSQNRFYETQKVRSDSLNMIICSVSCVKKTRYMLRMVASPTFLRVSYWLTVTDHLDVTLLSTVMDNNAVAVKEVSSTSCGYNLFTMVIDGDHRYFAKVPEMNWCIQNRPQESAKTTLLFQHNNNNLNGRTLRVGVLEWSSYLRKTNDATNASQVVYTGLSMDLLRFLRESLNFSVEYVDVSEEKNNGWSTLFGMLEKQQIDLMMAPTLPSKERLARMEMTYPISFIAIGAFYRQPSYLETRWRVVMDALSLPVVALVTSSVVFTSFVLICFDCFRLFIQETGIRKYRCTVWSSVASFAQNIFGLFGSLVRQEQTLNIGNFAPTQLMVAAWCVFGLVITVSFTAHLVPLLGLSKQTILFRSIRDVINNRDYSKGTMGGENWLLAFLKNAHSHDHRKLYKWIENQNTTDPDILSLNPDVHRDKVVRQQYVYLGSMQVMQPLFQNRCDILRVGEDLVSVAASLPMAKNSPYVDLFSRKIESMYENGLMQLLHKKWFPSPKPCSVDRTSTTAVDIVYLQSVFFLGAIGVVLSVLTVAMEILVRRTRVGS